MAVSNREAIARLARQIAEHQARIQVIAANWGEGVVDHLDATEKKVLSTLAEELKNFEFTPNAKKSLEALRAIGDRLIGIRSAAWQRSYNDILQSAQELADNEAKWAKRLTKEVSAPDTKLKDPTPSALDKVVKFGLADGVTIQQYFKRLEQDDAVRIEATINQGVASGWTIDQMARNITGSAANGYMDGIFQTTRNSALNMARTVCNAVSNNAKEATYKANADVLVGVEILATLDGRTCPICASLDRTRYKFDEEHPALPIHHNCRCVLLPVTPLSDAVEEERPMAKSDFMADAERAYKKKYPNKDWAALAQSTKRKYYYMAIREYEARTGEPAFTQVKGSVSFRQYFTEYMTEDQRRDWLGKERYELWRKGNLKLDLFIPPYPNPRMTVAKLRELDKESFAKIG